MRKNVGQNNFEYGQFYAIILPHKFRAVNRNFLKELKSICYIAQKILLIAPKNREHDYADLFRIQISCGPVIRIGQILNQDIHIWVLRPVVSLF